MAIDRETNVKDMTTSNQQPAKENKDSMAHKVGDAIEHSGDTLKEKGMNNLGEKLHDAGDKIEHMQDEK